jgi:hypothetical protein
MTKRDESKSAAGQSKTHQVRDRTTGELFKNPDGSDPTQTQWRDKTQFPRDKYERVDESGEVVPEESGGESGGSSSQS